MEHEIARFFWSLKDSLLFDIFQIISGKVYIFITCALFTAYAFIKFRKQAVIFLIASIIAVSVSDLLCYRVLKPAIKRLRPVAELNLNGSQNTGSQSTSSTKEDYSMPSIHASNIFAFFIVYFFLIKKIWSLLFFNSVLISLSRIITVKHFPSDVIAGIFIGTITGLSLVYLFSLFKSTRILAQVNKH